MTLGSSAMGRYFDLSVFERAQLAALSKLQNIGDAGGGDAAPVSRGQRSFDE